jgi:hypothetical protein
MVLSIGMNYTHEACSLVRGNKFVKGLFAKMLDFTIHIPRFNLQEQQQRKSKNKERRKEGRKERKINKC